MPTMFHRNIADVSSLPQNNVFTIFIRQLHNPLLIILLIATTISFALGEKTNAIVIFFMMSISISLGFWNEYQADKTVKDLLKKITFTIKIIRRGVKLLIPARDLQLEDIVLLYPGTVVPADLSLTHTQGLELDESVITGESLPNPKSHPGDKALMGSIVTSGSGEGIITALGSQTKFGQIAATVSRPRPQTSFQKGLTNFGLLILRVTTIMGLVIFIANVLMGKSLLASAMFSLAITIGLTPELLPVIVTVSLSHGGKRLARKKVIVKQLVSIEDLGNMEVLCCDKTGTLTKGRLSVISHQNVSGQEDDEVLKLGLICNSSIYHQGIHGEAIDVAIWSHAEADKYTLPVIPVKVYEQPFDFKIRAMFTIIKSAGKETLIVKGAPDVVIDKCDLSTSAKKSAKEKISHWYSEGYRAIAIATKSVKTSTGHKFNHFSDLKLAGFIIFSDIPKPKIEQSLLRLEELGVKLKIVTGDNEIVTKKICQKIGLSFQSILTGPELDQISDADLSSLAWRTNIFARMTPDQKLRILHALQTGGHTVGYLGDGVNDAPSLHHADVGISVDSGVDVAKDTASVILLEKDISVIADGVQEGRKTFANTIKYILMGTSSNFGNMFSVAAASFILPFLPMLPVQILLTNVLYDLSQLAIPIDNVDNEQLIRPRHWDISYITKYMLAFGPISSLYDIITFGLMFYIFQARGGLFQTGWFIESLISELLVIFLVRTNRSPFFKSRPHPLLVFSIAIICTFGLLLPFSPFAYIFSFTPPSPQFFVFLICMVISYLVLVEMVKWRLNKTFARQ